MFYLWLSLYLTIPVHGTPLKPCDQLSRKLCKDLGFGAFYCKVYVRIAQDASAKQKSCHNLLNDPKKWKLLISKLQKKEEELEKEEILAQRAGESATRQFERDKRRLEAFTIHSMIKKGKKKKTPPPPFQVCRALVKKACKDIGPSSYYCGLFRRILSVRGINTRRCLFILQRWHSSQRASFIQREALIQKLTKNAQTNRVLRKKVEKIKRHQGLQLLHFLSQ